MVEITSRADLEDWMEHVPHAWVQVVTARSALRALPSVLSDSLTDDWLANYSVNFFRAILVAWATCSLPSYDMKRAARMAMAPRHKAPDIVDQSMSGAGYTIGMALQASAADKYSYIFADIDDWQKSPSVDRYLSKAIETDCNWLTNKNDSYEDIAQQCVSKSIWINQAPIDWDLRILSMRNRLLALDPTYQVWIDWYNRRITGKVAAFDIPGDANRTEDKKILIRLVHATNKEFWRKGATHVNTTLQSWIDEARIDAEMNEILVKLRSDAATRIGTSDELEARRALLDALDRLSGKPPMQHGGIGHNYPPEGLDLVETSAALQSEVRAPIEAMATELQKTEPDPIIVAETALLFHRIIRKLEKMASVAGDKFAEEFGGELGKGAGKLVTRLPYALVALPLIEPILAWLRAVIG